MSAETLRRAAALMRERAEAALPRTRGLCGDWFEVGAADLDHLRHTEQRHIASWHPAVALAVADWLDGVARDWDENTTVDRPETGEYVAPAPEATWCDYCGGAIDSADYSAPDQRCDCYRWPTALAVARAYLGESS